MSDYNFLMESRLSPHQFQVVNHLSRLAATQGLNLYLVGGAVRDLTYGLQVTRDLDFAVEGNPQKILRHLELKTSPKARGAEGVPPAISHLRYNSRLSAGDLVFGHGVRAEIAMCRTETYTKRGRRPEVAPASVFEDLKRRDFSSNAMAVSLHPNSRGLLLDPTNGAADIENRELRVLRSRSFTEDPSRIYRLLRLCLRLGFKPEERTQRFLDAALENHVWEDLNDEQRLREIIAILHEEYPDRVLKDLAKRGLLRGLDRKLASVRLPYDRFAKIRSVTGTVPGADPFLLHFHCLTEKLGASRRNQLAKATVADRTTVRMALTLESEARRLARVLASAKAMLPSQVYTLLKDEPQALLLFLLVNFRQARIQSTIKSFLVKFPQTRMKLPRAELQALGIEPGPGFEKIIEQIFLERLDGKLNTRPQLLKALRSLAGIPEPKPARPARAAKPKAKRPARVAEKKGKPTKPTKRKK